MALELATALAEKGWRVTVLTGCAGNEPRSEIIGNVRIERTGMFEFTQGSLCRRAACFLALYPALLARALHLPRHDIVLTMTDPPLLALLGPILKGLKGGRLVHWCQDIYPEIAEELGAISKRGLLVNLCRLASNWALRRQDRIVVIGRCMKEKFIQRGIVEEVIRVIPNWAPAVREVAHELNPFRRVHDLTERFVVMYSGNFGRAHAFEPILAAAAQLQSSHPAALFLFVGGGAQQKKVQQFVKARQLSNVRFLPAQCSEELSQSLSGADLHLVSLQPQFCGLVVPSKIYGILAVGRPCIFIGPGESEVERLIKDYSCGSVIEGMDGALLARTIAEYADNPNRVRHAGSNARFAGQNFTLSCTVQSFQEVLRPLISTNEADGRVSDSSAEALPQQIPSKTSA
jgi:colanic acid biosynthesis glycosyl transferase WcaI